MKFSPTTRGFYLELVHGPLLLEDGEPNPDCTMPGDVFEIDDELYANLLAGQGEGKTIVVGPDGQPALADAPPPSEDQIQASFVQSIQRRLDDFARTRNYDSVLSACTYATSSVAKFRAEGQCAVDLRDQTWAAAYEILAEVLAGQRPMPASLADIEGDLPALEWPQ